MQTENIYLKCLKTNIFCLRESLVQTVLLFAFPKCFVICKRDMTKKVIFSYPACSAAPDINE